MHSLILIVLHFSFKPDLAINFILYPNSHLQKNEINQILCRFINLDFGQKIIAFIPLSAKMNFYNLHCFLHRLNY